MADDIGQAEAHGTMSGYDLGLLQNPKFDRWASRFPVQVGHLREIVPGWLVQHREANAESAASFAPLTTSPPAGLVLSARRAVPRLRVLQRLQWPAQFQHGRLRLSVTGIRALEPGLSLDWVAILAEDARKKWVFEDILLRQPPIGPDPSNWTIEYLKAVSDTPAVLVLNFSGEAGSVGISGIGFGVVPQSGVEWKSSSTYTGALCATADRRVLGWVRHQRATSEFVVCLDGAEVAPVKPSGLSKEAAAGDPRLRQFGFACDISLSDISQARITLRDRLSQVEIAAHEWNLSPVQAARSFAELPILPRDELLRRPDAAVVALPLPASLPSIAAEEGERLPRAEIDRVEGRLLIGWAVLEDGHKTVLLTVDGQTIGEVGADGLEARLHRGQDMLARHGFAIALPEGLRNDDERTVAFYDALTGRRLKTASARMRFREPKAPEPPPPARAPLNRASAPAPDGRLFGASSTAATKLAAGRLEVAVVAWDMSHNPVGRAFLLADMAATRHKAELIGPAFAFYGGRLWPPLGDSQLPMRSFPADDLKSFLTGAVELARNTRCDIVHVGKPRLPSLVLGALIRHFNACPMVVDIDDHELAFTRDHRPAAMAEILAAIREKSPELDRPYSDLWTRFGETLLREADLVTVSNVALRRRFGGIMLRHGRDERLFDPSLFDRRAVRDEFGFKEADRVILFLGTPRPHKGIFAIADALERLDDDRLVMCVIGTVPDQRTTTRFATYKKARILLHPDQPWQRLPELVNLADAVAILQESDHAITQYQMPAKLTDALAMDVPVLARVVPPIEDLALANAFEAVTDEASFDAALQRLAAAPPRSPGRGCREYFLSELSYGVNAARLDQAYAMARQGGLVERPLFEQTFRLLEERSGVALPRLVTRPPRQELRAPLVKSDRPRDLVFLWKQNDSDIYGRRSDMLAKYLLETGRVRRIIHFDRPISAPNLEREAEVAAGAAAHQGSLVYVNTVRRVLRAADTRDFIRRTFLHRAGSRPERALGQELWPESAYPDFVRAVLQEVGVDGAPLLWVSPVVFEYPQVADVVRPSMVIADLIDDQRTFPGSSEAYSGRVSQAYRTILSEADIVFTNCTPVRAAFGDLRSDIHVVPNGAEMLPDVGAWPLAPELRGLPHPIIGYVGNLRDRLDLTLIEEVAKRYPQGSIILVGSSHGRAELPELAGRHPNIHLLGVHPYQSAQRIMRGLDVAIMPHVKNMQSERMNPLKLYVYFAVGIPVVTTDVANIDDLAPYISVARDQPGFLAAIDHILNGGAREIAPGTRTKILRSVSWEARVNQIWRVVEEGFS